MLTKSFLFLDNSLAAGDLSRSSRETTFLSLVRVSGIAEVGVEGKFHGLQGHRCYHHPSFWKMAAFSDMEHVI